MALNQQETFNELVEERNALAVRLEKAEAELSALRERVKGLVADRPTIVCLCGSTRFADVFMAAQFRETIAGKIVLTVGSFPRKADGSWDRMVVTDAQKVELDVLHKRKIDLADEILVINVGGYIGDSTAGEMAHAVIKNKRIRYWEPDNTSEAEHKAGKALAAAAQAVEPQKGK